jgi:hypothetical protein
MNRSARVLLISLAAAALAVVVSAVLEVTLARIPQLAGASLGPYPVIRLCEVVAFATYGLFVPRLLKTSHTFLLVLIWPTIIAAFRLLEFDEAAAYSCHLGLLDCAYFIALRLECIFGAVLGLVLYFIKGKRRGLAHVVA